VEEVKNVTAINDGSLILSLSTFLSICYMSNFLIKNIIQNIFYIKVVYFIVDKT